MEEPKRLRCEVQLTAADLEPVLRAARELDVTRAWMLRRIILDWAKAKREAETE